MNEPMNNTEFRAAMDGLIAWLAPQVDCPCCLGDPDTVCDACGSHACWAGRFMCDNAQGAGTRPWREGDPVEPVAERHR
jgi:hypothetical protein